MAQLFFTVEAESESIADAQARSLTDSLREIKGVEDAERKKRSKDTMDLGTVISVLATSGAALALAQGLADWLRLRRSVTVVVEQDDSAGRIKYLVEQIDPETAKQIIELIKNGQST
ncbi:effector-associated constant component EACC1 [Pseudomonas entomophila]|uniref:effector-associated constant component EACC1 n=1 Tax=Pseudomonas entomophila TaxID=312306 RepID=UPI001F00B992|nr:hypothetical protein [Pseudomonas entomophila]MCG8295276.1 hypothetical protein [Pseudomonas entomophila]